MVVMCLVRSLADSPGGTGTESDREVNSNEGFFNEKVDPSFNNPGWKHIMVGGRSMVIDVHAL